MYHNPYKVCDCCIFYEPFPFSDHLGKCKVHNIHVDFNDWCSKFSASKHSDLEDKKQ